MARLDPPDPLQARAGTAAAVVEPRLSGATAAARRVREHTLEAVARSASGKSELAPLPAVGELDARIERPNPAPAMTEAFASFGPDELVVPPEARLRPVPDGDASARQSVLGAEFAAVTAAPLDKLDKGSAIEDAETLWRSAPLAFGSRARLEQVFDDSSAVAGELARARAAGA
jgi:hypothetical protein